MRTATDPAAKVDSDDTIADFFEGQVDTGRHPLDRATDTDDDGFDRDKAGDADSAPFRRTPQRLIPTSPHRTAATDETAPSARAGTRPRLGSDGVRPDRVGAGTDRSASDSLRTRRLRVPRPYMMPPADPRRCSSPSSLVKADAHSDGQHHSKESRTPVACHGHPDIRGRIPRRGSAGGFELIPRPRGPWFAVRHARLSRR
jgi:hypothetical protein